MNTTHLPKNITPRTFDRLLSRYPSCVPEKLAELERERFHVIPAVLEQRKRDGGAWLEKGELVRLVEWKL